MKHYAYNSPFNMVDKDENKYRLTVEREHDPESPRHWDNVATMICFHRRYNLGDKHNYNDLQEALEHLADKVGVKYNSIDGINLTTKERDMQLIEDLKPYYCIQYLYLYDHSGISMSTSSFVGRALHAEWDSGIVGIVYVSKEDAFNNYGKINENNWYDETSNHIDGEVKVYDQYLTGEVYGYKLEKLTTIEEKCPHCDEVIKTYTEWEEVDSCWGFYGDHLEENGILDYIDLEFVD